MYNLENIIGYSDLELLVKKHLGIENQWVTLRTDKEGIYVHYGNGMEGFIDVFTLAELLENNGYLVGYYGYVKCSDVMVRYLGGFINVVLYKSENNIYFLLVKDNVGEVIYGRLFVHDYQLASVLKSIKYNCSISRGLISFDAMEGIWRFTKGLFLFCSGSLYGELKVSVLPRYILVSSHTNGLYEVHYSDIFYNSSKPQKVILGHF